MILKRIRENWSASKTYRVLLVAAIVYALLRFAVQVYLFTDALTTQSTAEGAQISSDLQDMEFYQFHPTGIFKLGRIFTCKGRWKS